MGKYAVPLLILVAFGLLLLFLFLGLFRDPHEVPSPLINKAAPAFQLPQLQDPGKTFSPQEMRGKVWLLNVWASWCVPCREEHPLLIELSRSGVVPIYGLNYKDKREDALSLLNELGNPYVLTAADAEGRAGIDYGVYGVPESYLIDKTGVIRYKQIGPITSAAWQQNILPLVRQLSQ